MTYISSSIPALVQEGLPSILNDIEAELVEMRVKYTDEDISSIDDNIRSIQKSLKLDDKTISKIKSEVEEISVEK